MIDLAPNGRSVYVTNSGVVEKKLNIFFSEPEHEMLRRLADEINVPIGNLIVQLAHKERQRRLGEIK